MISPNAHATVVVGRDADEAVIREHVSSASSVLFLSLEGSRRMADSLEGIAQSVVVPGETTSELEARAWFWVTELVEALSRIHGISRDRLLLVRRTVFAQTLLPIASAIALANEVKRLVRPGDAVIGLGLSRVEERSVSRLPNAQLGAAFSTGRAAVRSHSVTPGSDASTSGSGRIVAATVASVRTRLARPQAREADRLYVAAFVKYPVHLRLLASTLEELSARGWGVTVVDMSAGAALRDATRGAEYETYSGFYHEHTLLRVVRRYSWGTWVLEPAVRRWARDAGLSDFGDLIAKAVNRAYCVRSAAAIDAHTMLHRRVGNAVALTVNEQALDTEACEFAGRKSGFKVVNVQHGVITTTKLRAELDYDAFCVFGEGYAEVLASNGAPRASIRVVGNPLLDRPHSSTLECSDPSATKARMGIPDGAFTVLFAAQHRNPNLSDSLLYRMLAPVLEAAERDVNMFVIIKWHPLGEGHEFGYLAALEDHAVPRVAMTRDEKLHDLIELSDCVALFSSTVGFEAAAFSKPVIVVVPHSENDTTPFVAEGTALLAQDAPQFGDCVARIRAGWGSDAARYTAFDERYHFLRDGRTAARIADVCEEMASK